MKRTITFNASSQAVADFEAAAKERDFSSGKALVRSFVKGVIFEYRQARRDPRAEIAAELETEITE